MSKSKVVILGGGFAGLHAAKSLTKKGHQVTIVDRHPYTTFQPLLYQVATAGLNPGDITYPLRRVVGDDRTGLTSFRRATVEGVDFENKTVQVSRGADLPYDKLIIALGVGANYFGIEGAEEHTRLIYTRKQSLEVRDIIFSGLEKMAAEDDRDSRFTVAVVGGGPTGVEMAGTLAEMKTQAVPTLYPEISVDNFHVALIEMSNRLLGPFEEKLQRYTLRELRSRGVDVRLNTAVKKVAPDHLEFADGNTMNTDLVVWASGVGPHPIVKELGLPLGRGGRIKIGKDLLVEGFEDVFALGDCAICEEDPLPQLAQPAIQMGDLMGKQVEALDKGEPLEEFSYFDKGTMATIGRNAAVMQFPNGIASSGLIAWIAWVFVHIMSLLGGRNQLFTMLNMTIRYWTWPKSAANIIGDPIDAPSVAAKKKNDKK